MTAHSLDHLQNWIGRERMETDLVTPRLAAGLFAVLGGEGSTASGAPAPAGIHWCLAPDIVPMNQIGADGHPSRGGFLPPVELPRRMWAGGELNYAGDFRIGDLVTRRSRIEKVEGKTGRSGEMIFVTVRHSYSVDGKDVLDERQDIVYRNLSAADNAMAPSPGADIAEHSRHVDSGSVLLFRYSALTFNGHRIHYDWPYVTEVEGYSGLLFHGPLQATMLLDFATELSGGDRPDLFSFRAVRPLIAGHRVSINAKVAGQQTRLWVADHDGSVTMTAISTSPS